MNKKAFSIVLIAIMIAGTLAVAAPRVKAVGPSIEVVPSSLTFGPAPVVGTTFSITVQVLNVVNLYGVDIQFGWDENWVGIVSHQKHIPVETYADGILHSPTVPVKDTVSEGVPMVGADPNSDYWLAEASMTPAPVFTGSGIAFDMTFVIKQQPLEPAPDHVVTLNITTFTLADSGGNPIPSVIEVDGTVTIKQAPFVYPPKPLLYITPTAVSGIPAGSFFDSSINLAGSPDGVSIVPLDPLWDVAGFDMTFNFDPTLIQATAVTVDPDGWFGAFWPSGVFVVMTPIDNVAGTVQIVFLGLPGAGGVHTPPSGQGRIAAITFTSIYDSSTFPPPSCALTLAPTVIAGFPHPERPQFPWNSMESSPPLDHFTQGATYTAYFAPPGAYIDIYTEFYGVGPNAPADMLWPQKSMKVFAAVSYNFWPEQQKDVAFQLIDPHGTTWGVFYNRTDANGIAWVFIRFPWPCDNPEYYFGYDANGLATPWTIVATVDVASKVVSDTMPFKYDYRVRIWKTTVDKASYAHGEMITVTIDYGTTSMTTFDALFTVTATDETGVPFAYAASWATVGGAAWCTYKNGTISLTLYIPKFARAGLATLYVGVLSELPMSGGDAYYPTRPPESQITFGIEAA